MTTHVAPPLEQTIRFRHFSCPECQGTLERVQQETAGTISYLCRIGHRYSARELLVGKELVIEHMLWASLTAVDELIVMLAGLEERSGERGNLASHVARYRTRSEIAIRLRAALEQIIADNEPVDVGDDGPMETDPNARPQLRRGG